MSTGLTLWTVYDHPTDYPDMFVARLWINDKPTGHMLGSTELEDLREMLQALDPSLTCMPRHPDDDPKIVEVWL